MERKYCRPAKANSLTLLAGVDDHERQRETLVVVDAAQHEHAG
jgi:hypothetical protein